jgi:hypothetical protein
MRAGLSAIAASLLLAVFLGPQVLFCGHAEIPAASTAKPDADHHLGPSREPAGPAILVPREDRDTWARLGRFEPLKWALPIGPRCALGALPSALAVGGDGEATLLDRGAACLVGLHCLLTV